MKPEVSFVLISVDDTLKFRVDGERREFSEPEDLAGFLKEHELSHSVVMCSSSVRPGTFGETNPGKPEVSFVLISVDDTLKFRVDGELREFSEPEDLAGFLKEHELSHSVVMCSSSVDFPEESTSRQWVIDWCRQARGAENEESA